VGIGALSITSFQTSGTLDVLSGPKPLRTVAFIVMIVMIDVIDVIDVMVPAATPVGPIVEPLDIVGNKRPTAAREG
jgi:hypothetical protein